MSVHKQHDYPRAPLTVTTNGGRTLDFEVDRDGSILITAEVDDHSAWGGQRTTEVAFWLTPDDWEAVVAHIARDARLPEGN